MRTDIHRESEIVPGNYEYLFSYSLPGWGVWDSYNVFLLKATRAEKGSVQAPVFHFDGAFAPAIVGYQTIMSPWGKLNYFHDEPGKCDVCGARFRHGAVYRHRGTGEAIHIGHICADKMELHWDRSAFEAAHSNLEAAKLRFQARRVRREQLRDWAKGNQDILPLLRTDHRIVRNMRAAVISKPLYGLTARQVDLLRKLAVEAAEKSSQPPMVPVPTGGSRMTIIGKLVRVKYNHFGTPKGLILAEVGGGVCKLWGTIPLDLWDKRGSVVSLKARVYASDRDPCFGFFKNPTQAAVVTQ